MTKEDVEFLDANPTPKPEKTRKGGRRYKAWTQDDGWCSACLMTDRRVVLFGRPDAHCGLCQRCLDGLRSTLLASEGGGK